METVLHTSHKAIKQWSNDIQKDVLKWAEHPEIEGLAQELLELPANHDALIGSPVQAALRRVISPFLSDQNLYGFFIIGSSNINYASLRDENVGDINILSKQKNILLKAWSGETVVSLPMPSDVPLPGINGELREGEPTMFAGAPIKDETGKVIAVLTFRVNPAEAFSKILQRGRIGETGETYAFDRNAFMISESRFSDQLRQSGLIAPDQTDMLNIMLHDPGVNLVKEEHVAGDIRERPLTFMAENALSGKSTYNMEGYNDYRGVRVLGVWLWDNDLNFGLATEVDFSEAYGFLGILRGVLIGFSTIVALLILLLSIVFIVSRRRLVISEERIKNLLASTAEAIYGVDLNGVCAFCNASCLKMLGYEHKEELLGKYMHELIHHSYPDGTPYPVEECQIYTSFRTGKGIHCDSEILWRKNGTSFPAEYWSYPVTHDGKPVGSVVTFFDISERQQIQQALELTNLELEKKNQALKEMAVSDGLTGVANRRAFDDHLQAEWNRGLRSGTPVSLILFDIDFFKDYNDCYGHLEGDACLKRVAKTLLNSDYINRPGDLAARYGGEEFAIILSNTDEESAFNIGERIRTGVENLNIPHKVANFEVVTFSAGVASMVPQTGGTQDQLIKAADEALYYAKNQGRNQSVSQSDINALSQDLTP